MEEKYLKEERVGKWHIVMEKGYCCLLIRVLNSENGAEHYKTESYCDWESARDRNFNQVVDMVKNWKIK